MTETVFTQDMTNEHPTNQQVVEEIDRQIAEYGCYEADAIENVADYIGLSWRATAALYWEYKGVVL